MLPHILPPLLLLVSLAIGLPTNQGEPEDCCDEKTVGGVRYINIGSDNSGEAESRNCLSSCIFMREGEPNSKVCFKAGDLAVECQDNAPSMIAGAPIETEVLDTSIEADFFEGDMRLNPEQLEMLKAALITGSLEDVQASEMSSDEPQGNAVINTRYRWPSRIVKYQISSYISRTHQTLIRNTMNNLQRKLDSCLRFVESNSGNRVYVKNNKAGCFSAVGYQARTQDLNLANGCMSTGIIEHEFLHAIGIYHHQSRSDRDSYVRIYLGNVPKGQRHNFNKYKSDRVTHYGIPYDYGSLMHYGGTAFGIGGRTTIQTIDRSKQNVIGQRKGVSASDILMIKKMYNCGAQPTAKGIGGPDDWNFCKGRACSEGQGDCDGDDECSGSLVCGTDNCRTYNRGALKTSDCCEKSGGGGGKCAYTDKKTECPGWAKEGYCNDDTYKDYMNTNCGKSCKCGGGGGGNACAYTDNKQECPGWAKDGYCNHNDYKDWMNTNCGKSCKCDTKTATCQPEDGVNYQERVSSKVIPGVSSWQICSQKCKADSSCKAWVWNKASAGVYAYKCAIMAGYKNKASDTNTVAGPRCKQTVYDCQEVGVNYQQRVGSSVKQNVASWKECQTICKDDPSCKAWVWNKASAGVYANRCAIMAGYKNKAADVNTVAGPKNCN